MNKRPRYGRLLCLATMLEEEPITNDPRVPGPAPKPGRPNLGDWGQISGPPFPGRAAPGARVL